MKKAFTLIELLIVIAIVGVISGVVLAFQADSKSEQVPPFGVMFCLNVENISTSDTYFENQVKCAKLRKEDEKDTRAVWENKCGKDNVKWHFFSGDWIPDFECKDYSIVELPKK